MFFKKFYLIILLAFLSQNAHAGVCSALIKDMNKYGACMKKQSDLCRKNAKTDQAKMQCIANAMNTNQVEQAVDKMLAPVMACKAKAKTQKEKFRCEKLLDKK